MKYLLFTPEDGEEICYNIEQITDIVCGYAQNILNESDMEGNGIKPLEMVTRINFTDGQTATYQTDGSKIYFD